MESQRADGRTAATRALAMSGFPVLGVALANLLTRGFSWGDMGALALIRALLSSVLLLFFWGRVSFGRRR